MLKINDQLYVDPFKITEVKVSGREDLCQTEIIMDNGIIYTWKYHKRFPEAEAELARLAVTVRNHKISERMLGG